MRAVSCGSWPIGGSTVTAIVTDKFLPTLHSDSRSPDTIMSYDAVLYDNDGILTELTDLETLYAGIRRAFREFEVDDPPATDVEALANVSLEDLTRICEGHAISAEQFWPRRDHHASAVQREVIRAGEKPLYDDVEAIASLEVPQGVVSNNQQATVDFIVEFFDLEDVFDIVYGREPIVEGLHRKKPNTYYVERAISALDAEDALFVGDSPADVLAADRAGVDSAFVRRPHRRDLSLPVTPTFEIEDLHAIPRLLDGDREEFRPPAGRT